MKEKKDISVWVHSFIPKGWVTSAQGVAEDVLLGFNFEIFEDKYITFSVKTETTEDDDDPSWYAMLQDYSIEYLKGIHYLQHGLSCREIGDGSYTIYYYTVGVCKGVTLPQELKKKDEVQVYLVAQAESDL